MSINKLILGDNLEILKTLETESIDLIYLDPPFFSNRNYEVIWGDDGEVRSFQDRWAGGIDNYIAWLKERVAEMYRILKKTGSIFLHCDDHANSYIQVEVLDKLFGRENYHSQITWKRSSAHNDAKQGRKALGNISDTIFYYSKSNNYTFNQLYTKYDNDYIDSNYSNVEQGTGRRFKSTDLTAAKGGGDTLYEWKGKKPTAGRAWAYSKENMQIFENENRLFYTSTGMPRLKQYLDEMRGIPLQNIWSDIKVISSQSKERIGYPTQKPEALLERIINMASNEGDVVLDPFVGGGTTIAVADRLNRKWIGIDQSPMAVKVTEFRLQKQTGLFTAPYTLQLHKYDYDTLRNSNAFEFESWIVQQFGGTSNTKQRNDLGLDGKMPDNTPIQVKRSDNIGRNVIDNFKSAVERYDKKLMEKNIADKKPFGYVIAFSFGKGAVEEVARLKLKENIIIELITVDKIVPIAKKPSIKVEINELSKNAKGIREIEFTASGHSEAGIEFYSWDFEYDEEKGFKPNILLDKEGKQVISLKTGTHSIAVKVVDNDGLENTEIVKLKINGVVEKV